MRERAGVRPEVLLSGMGKLYGGVIIAHCGLSVPIGVRKATLASSSMVLLTDAGPERLLVVLRMRRHEVATIMRS